MFLLELEICTFAREILIISRMNVTVFFIHRIIASDANKLCHPVAVKSHNLVLKLLRLEEMCCPLAHESLFTRNAKM